MKKGLKLFIVWTLVLLLSLGSNFMVFADNGIHVHIRDGEQYVKDMYILCVDMSRIEMNPVNSKSYKSVSGAVNLDKAHKIILIRHNGIEEILIPSIKYPGTDNYDVDIRNAAPIAVADSYMADQGVQLSIPVTNGILKNDSDPDNSTITAKLVSDATNGTLALNADGSFTYTSNLEFVGTDSFTYQVSDGESDSNAATVTITVNKAGNRL